jgi:hypothetical protein
MRRPLATCAALAATCFVAAAFHALEGSAVRKGAQIIMFHGGPLEKPIFMRDMGPNAQVLKGMMLGDGPGPHAAPQGAAVVDMALFIRYEWRHYNRPDSLPKLRPGMADQTGRLHIPADGGRAVSVLASPPTSTTGPRRNYLPEYAENHLRRAGLPIPERR